MKVNYAHIKPSGNIEVTFTPPELNLLVGSLAYEAWNNKTLHKDTKEKLACMVDKLQKHI